MDDSINIAQLGIKTSGVVGHYWYASLDANVIRNFVDTSFSGLAKDVVADCARGQGHRWAAGHDLLTDVLPRFSSAPGGALHQAGHILLTDFPTKAGIPIPGLSAGGIGQQLVELGIPKGYLCLNVADSAIGIIAVSESHADLITSLNGGTLDGWTAFDTFGEGTLELYAGIQSQNPLLIIGGIENTLAGVVSTYNTIKIAIDKMVTTIEEFFGATLGGAMLGIGVSLFLSRNATTQERIRQVLLSGSRAAILGGASAISPFLSLGLAAGLCFHELCKSILNRKIVVHEYNKGIYRVTLESCMESETFREAWKSYYSHQQAIEAIGDSNTSLYKSFVNEDKQLEMNIDKVIPQEKLPIQSTDTNKEREIVNLINEQNRNIQQLLHP